MPHYYCEQDQQPAHDANAMHFVKPQEQNMKTLTCPACKPLVRLGLVFLLATLFPILSVANEAAHGEAGSGEEEAHEAHHKHALGLFVGITREHSENLSTLGIEYAYRINPRWSVGGVVERADRETDSTLLIAFVHYWAWKGLYFGGGLGKKDPGKERENTFRASIGYEFEFGNGWMLNSQFNLDYIEHHDREEVYGVAFGKVF